MRVKESGLFFLLLFFVVQATSQKICLPKNQLPKNTVAFRKMMLDYTGYAINSTTAPAPGIALQTNKPTLAFSGNIPAGQDKGVIINLRAEGGADNNIGRLFSKSSVNGFFKISAGINIFNGYGKATYKNVAGEGCIQLKKAIKMIAAHKDVLLLQSDTAVIAKTFFADSLPFTFDEFVQLIKVKASFYKLEGHPRNDNIYTDDYYRSLAIAMMIGYGMPPELPATQMFNELKDKLAYNPLTIAGIDKLAGDYLRLKPLPTKLKSQQDAYANDLLKELWQRQSITWFNITPYAGNGGLTMYDTVKKKIYDTSALQYGMQVSFNSFTKYKNGGKFFYWNIGAGMGWTNNIAELNTLDYQLQSTLNSTGPVTTTKTGTAYKGRFDQGFGETIFTEIFHAPFAENFMPGYYISVKYQHNDAWINNNKINVATGLLWNINSSSGKKNILSIMPCAGWLNVLKEYKTKAHTTTQNLGDLFYFNIKLGVPLGGARE